MGPDSGADLDTALAAFVAEHATLPASVLLGHLVFTTVREAGYDRTKIAAWVGELGLDPQFLPRADTALNAYRKATKSVDDTHYQLPGDFTGHILMRDLGADPEGQTRVLVREITRPPRKGIAHDTVAEIRFYRASIRAGRQVPGSERLRITVNSPVLKPGEYPHLQQVVKQIEEAYKRTLRVVDGAKVRWMLRDYLGSLDGVPVRPSTYFVHISQEQALAQLKDLAERLGCQLHRLPMAAVPEARQMLARAVEVDAVTELERLGHDIGLLREKCRSISGEAYSALKARYDRVLVTAWRYCGWLDTTMPEVGAAADAALEQIDQLRKEVQ